MILESSTDSFDDNEHDYLPTSIAAEFVLYVRIHNKKSIAQCEDYLQNTLHLINVVDYTYKDYGYYFRNTDAAFDFMEKCGSKIIVNGNR